MYILYEITLFFYEQFEELDLKDISPKPVGKDSEWRSCCCQPCYIWTKLRTIVTATCGSGGTCSWNLFVLTAWLISPKIFTSYLSADLCLGGKFSLSGNMNKTCSVYTKLCIIAHVKSKYHAWEPAMSTWVICIIHNVPNSVLWQETCCLVPLSKRHWITHHVVMLSFQCWWETVYIKWSCARSTCR